MGGELTLQQVSLDEPGSALSTRPENMPEQMGGVWVDVALPADFSARASVDYTGAQFCQDPNTGNDVELDGGAWLNTSVGRTWRLSRSRARRGGFGGFGGRVETRLTASNLANTVLYDQCGLPRAGRLLQFELRVF